MTVQIAGLPAPAGSSAAQDVRRSAPRTARRVTAFFLLAFVAVGSSCASLAVAAATVDGEKITEATVESELDTLREDPIFGEALRRDADTRGQRRREILTTLIREAVAEHEAEQLGVEVTREEETRLIAREAAARGMSVADLLKQENLSSADAQRIAERQVRRTKLTQSVVREVDVDEKAVREAYEGQEELFVEVHLERITVRDERAAREVIQEVSGGASFADVARERSADDLADSGGDMGFIPLSGLDVEVQGAVGGAEEGGLTDPIPRPDGGFEVYRLAERRTKSFEDVAGEIRLALTQQEREQRYEEWLNERVRRADIVVNPKYGRFDKEQTPPSVVPATGELAP